MSHPDHVIDVCKPAEFTIDGHAYRTTIRWRAAADLLTLAGLDPSRHQLGELRRGRTEPLRYGRTDIVGIHRGARFVTGPLVVDQR